MDTGEQKISLEEKCAIQIVGNVNENMGLEIGKMKNEMSSSSIGKNENGNSDSEQKIKKRIKFGGWLPELLDWIKRTELAQSSLPTSSLTFHQYCYRKLHGRKVKPRIVPNLTFSCRQDDQGNWQTILEKGWYNFVPIPIADIKPPDYITGFEQIDFEFIDDQVLQFVEKILPLLKEVIIYYGRVFEEEDNPQIGQIKHMMELLAPKTKKLSINITTHLNKFIEHFLNFIYGVQSITIPHYKEKHMELAVKWLTRPRDDGKPKFLSIIYFHNSPLFSYLIERVKEEFVHSTERASFFLALERFGDRIPRKKEKRKNFKIENQTTKEWLELQKFQRQDGGDSYVLGRYKKDDETTLEEELEKIRQWQTMSESTINISIC